MKEATARSVLTIDSRVCWDNDKSKGGTVIEHTYNRCKVRWDDPSEGEYSILYFTEMGNIGLLPANRTYKAGDVTNLSAREVGII